MILLKILARHNPSFSADLYNLILYYLCCMRWWILCHIHTYTHTHVHLPFYKHASSQIGESLNFYRFFDGSWLIVRVFHQCGLNLSWLKPVFWTNAPTMSHPSKRDVSRAATAPFTTTTDEQSIVHLLAAWLFYFHSHLFQPDVPVTRGQSRMERNDNVRVTLVF